MAKTKWFYFRNLKDKECFMTSMPETYRGKDEYEELGQTEGLAAYRKSTQAYLRKMLKPGTEVNTILTHVSSSGMTRHYRVFIVHKGEIRDITKSVADAAGFSTKEDGRWHIVVGGCGFDGGFEIVHNLGYALWPNGTKKPHGTRNGEPDHSGGYALSHRSL